MTLSIWKNGQVAANVLGGISPYPSVAYPEQHRCVLNKLIDAEDHYESYPSDGSGKQIHIEGISCWPENENIVFIFVVTG